jgi:5-hydroxyisourate hydrolase-like protein (transthyretin family)
MNHTILRTVGPAALFSFAALTSVSASAADRIDGRVEGGGGPVANAAVTLWVVGTSAPRKLAETQTVDDGRFDVTVANREGSAGVLCLVAKDGDALARAGNGPRLHETAQ